jgi:putative SOS response-associated peptidase YedK
MCGRTSLIHDGYEIRTVFRLSDEYAKHMELRARYNVAPGTDIAAIRAGEPRVLTPMRWGLIPSWAKDAKIGYSMINARGETVPEKPAFRSAFKKRRCVIPVSGWYEWRKNPDGTKTPMYFHRADGGLLALAGLWEEWKSPESKLVTSCAIVTVAAVPRFAAIHDRMPLILGKVEDWLQEADLDAARPLLAVPAHDGIDVHPVSTLVNRPQTDSPDCIRPA